VRSADSRGCTLYILHPFTTLGGAQWGICAYVVHDSGHSCIRYRIHAAARVCIGAQRRTSQTSPASPGSVACAGRAAKRRSHTATLPAAAPLAARCGRDACTATQLICRSASCAQPARLWASCSLPVPGPASHPPAGHLQQAAARRPGERTDGEAAGAETVRVKLQTALRQGVSVSDRRSRSRSARTVKPRTGGQPVMPQLWGERCAGAAPPCRRSQTSRPPARASADT